MCRNNTLELFYTRGTKDLPQMNDRNIISASSCSCQVAIILKGTLCFKLRFCYPLNITVTRKWRMVAREQRILLRIPEGHCWEVPNENSYFGFPVTLKSDRKRPRSLGKFDTNAKAPSLIQICWSLFAHLRSRPASSSAPGSRKAPRDLSYCHHRT